MFTLFGKNNPIHESHTEVILKNLGYDKWVHRDVLQIATQSKNLGARITRARTRIPKGNTIICLMHRKKIFKMFSTITDTFYAVIAEDLLDTPTKTTYTTETLPQAVSELLGKPTKPRFRKIFFK